jgi:hypothetical protein
MIHSTKEQAEHDHRKHSEGDGYDLRADGVLLRDGLERLSDAFQDLAYTVRQEEELRRKRFQ